MRLPRLVSILSTGLLLTALGGLPQRLSAAQAPPAAQAQPSQDARQLQQLVAPIALYPDALVAQILAASTYPEQVVQADRWLQAHPGLRGSALGAAVDPQPWDPSVKALTGFPAVLGNMDKNLAWTSSLGDAYYNQQPELMDAVQVMRRRARSAGKLNSNAQQNVAQVDQTLTITPSDPEVIYVPAYDPWLIYGGPMVAWPGWYPYPGIFLGGPYLSFGAGFGIGFGGGFGWGWSHWGFDWHGRYATYNNGRYVSRTNTFYNRDHFYRGAGARGGAMYGAGRGAGLRSGGNTAFRGTAQAGPGRSPAPARAGAFSGIQHGGAVRGFSARGSASFGGHRR